MAASDTVSGDVARLVLAFAARAGIDAASGLPGRADLAAVSRPGARLGAAQFSTLLDAVAAASRDPCFGLHLGEAAPLLSSGHVLFTLMRNGRTVDQAVRRFFRYHAILADVPRPALRLRDGLAWITLEGGAARASRHHVDAVLAMLATAVRSLCAAPVVPRLACSSHPPPAAAGEHERVLGCPVRFGAREDALGYEPDALAREVLLADRELFLAADRLAVQQLARTAPDHPWKGRVNAAIAGAVAAGEAPRIAEAATTLGVGPRRLQQRLRAEGTSFQRQLDEVRKQLAMACLRDGRSSPCDVAFLLGFSEQSAFTRAFRRWTGTTPGAFATGAASAARVRSPRKPRAPPSVARAAGRRRGA